MINETIGLVKQFDVDGLNIDWRYPEKQYKHAYAQFLKGIFWIISRF